MKPSHFQTPRAMSETIFDYSSDPIEKPIEQLHPADVVLYVLGFFSLLIVWMVL